VSVDGDVRRAAEAIKSADALLICAGAGMGVDSGLPDFRGTQGFWRAYPVLARLGVSFEEMANPRWFKEDPALAWAFYGHRLNLYRGTAPHSGFSRLQAIGASKPRG
jgi:NAD-dependent SIR2 family protein deacetylase